MRSLSARSSHPFFVSIASSLLMVAAATAPAAAQSTPESKDMALVGANDLQARSAYQPTIHQQGGRWIAYIGHHGGTKEVPKPVNPLTGVPEFNGTSILDVTDPRDPKYLVHLPGDEGLAEQGGAQMVRVCDGKTLPKGDPNAVYMLRTFANSAHEIWNVADPAKPKLVTSLGGLKGTHKNWWECDTGIAYLVSGVPGWRVDRMTEVYDLGDPAKPVKIRDFGLLGQQPGAAGRAPTRLHGPISTGPKGNRIYFAYGTNEGGILQIVDREKLLNGPKEPTEANLLYPQVGRLDMWPLRGAHGVPGAGHADRRVRQGQGRQGAQLRGRHQRADQERVPGAAPVRVVRRRDGGAAPGLGLDLDRAGGVGRLLQPRRALRHARLP